MRRKRRRFFRDDVLAPWVTLGVIVGFWWLSAMAIGREGPAPVVRPMPSPAAPAPAPTAPAPTARALPPPSAATPAPPPGGAAVTAASGTSDTAASADIRELLDKKLLIPVNGMKASSLQSTFGDPRSDSRAHEALDILAPRGTPVVAALDGKIVKLFTSNRGGLTIYQFDPEERFCYYYAHLDSYASGLKEGDEVTQGQTIGYVGTTGNAPPGTPHLHFAITKLDADKHWWQGEPIDPYLVLH